MASIISNHARFARHKFRVNILAAFYRSSVGKKIIVAVTGIILILFVIGHLLGNLQIFLGPNWINGYSQHLRDLGPLLWAIRALRRTGDKEVGVCDCVHSAIAS